MAPFTGERNLRILIVNNRYPPLITGGYELSAALAAEGLRGRGHSVQVLVTRFGVLPGTDARGGFVHRRLHRTVDSSSPAAIAAYDALDRACIRRTIRRLRPDLVSVWNLHGTFPGVLLEIQRSRVPVVFHLHDLWLEQLEAWTLQWSRFWGQQAGAWWRRYPKRCLASALRRAGLVTETGPEIRSLPNAVFCSHFARSYHEANGISAADSRVIYSGVDTARFRPRPRESGNHSLRLLFVGRFVPEKGPDVALAALQELSREGRHDLELTAMGTIPPDRRFFDALRARAAESGLDGRVRFLAATAHDELDSLYAEHDVLVFPSVREGLPRSVMEAMACGLAIVSTPAGGTAEMLRNEENALVFPVGDSVRLASALRRLKDDPGLVQRLGQAARGDAVARFDVSRTVAEIDEYYHEVLAMRLASAAQPSLS